MVAARAFWESLAATIMTTAVVIAVRPISSCRPYMEQVGLILNTDWLKQLETKPLPQK